MGKEVVQNNKIATPEAQTGPQEAAQPSTQVPEAPKQKPWFIIGIAVLVLLLLGTTGFFAYQYFQLRQQTSQTQPIPSAAPSFPPGTITDEQTYDSTLGYSFEYPKDWQANTFVVKKGETKRRPSKYDINATQADIEVVEISKSNWTVEIQASSKPKPESCGYQGPISGEALKQYKPLSILNKRAARLDIENGYYWQGGNRSEPYPQPIMFPKPLSNDLKQKLNITGEAFNYHWCTENPENNLQLSFVYYSNNLTKDKITDGTLDGQVLSEMDQILSTFKFIETSSSWQENKTTLLQRLEEYINALIAEDRELAMSYLTDGVKPDVFETWPSGYKQFKTYEVLSEFHSEQEEQDYYNQEKITVPIKLYKENDQHGNIARLLFVKENNAWKTLTWYLFP